ncbi:MAG: hypothetical protein MJE77_09015 [Proteobacteria bacterium]|nr:hypothetical protein [Pseudomonadota bacterium]
MLCALAVLMILVIGACRTSVTAKPWHQVTTRNFRVLSTLDRNRTVKLSRELEGFRAAVGQTLPVPLPERAFPAQVYMFEDEGDWEAFAPQKNVAGYFLPGWRSWIIAINGSMAEEHSRRIVYHEYVHELINQSGAAYPDWYEEGLAGISHQAGN